MTTAQKLAVRLSEIRQRLNEIAGLDDEGMTEEVRGEADKLAEEFRSKETQHRSALIGEADEQRAAEGAFGNGDGEAAETRALLSRAGLADYVRAGISGRELAGAPSELNAALDCPIVGVDGGIAIPWRVIRGQRAPESRQAPDPERRAFTTTGAYDGPTTQQTILDELFGVGILDAMGVSLESAPAGAREYPIISGNVAPAQTAEGTAASAAVAATFEVANLRPKKLTAHAEFTHEMQASVVGLEETIRRNLMERIQSEMSNIVINGLEPDMTNPERIEGFLTAITVPADPPAEATFADYASAHAGNVDGIFAMRETEVSSIIGTDVYGHAASVYQTGSGESGSEALMRRSMGCMASSYIPAAVSDISKGNLFHSKGGNAGGPMMRRDSAAAVWPVLSLVRDHYSKASQGIVLTGIMLWDVKVAFRASAYRRVAFTLA